MSKPKHPTIDDMIGRLKKTAGLGEGNPPTSHPTAGPQEGQVSINTGPRDSEHKEDMKKQTGGGPEASNATPTTPGDTSASTTNPKPTGEDPENERGLKDNPGLETGTSHPANGNEAEKYSSLRELLDGTRQMIKEGSAFIAALHNTPAPAKPAAPAAATNSKVAADQSTDDAGSVTATPEQQVELRKVAAHYAGAAIRIGYEDGLTFCSFLQKQAEDEAAEKGEDDDDEDEGGEEGKKSEPPVGDPAADAAGGNQGAPAGSNQGADTAAGLTGEPPAAMAGGDAGGGLGDVSPEEIQALLQLLQGGAAGAGGMPGPDMGAMGAGGDMGALGDGDGDEGAMIAGDEIAQLAEQEGITPEELEGVVKGAGVALKKAQARLRAKRASGKVAAKLSRNPHYEQQYRLFVRKNAVAALAEAMQANGLTA